MTIVLQDFYGATVEEFSKETVEVFKAVVDRVTIEMAVKNSAFRGHGKEEQHHHFFLHLGEIVKEIVTSKITFFIKIIRFPLAELRAKQKR